jgi:hypothetical protein
MEARESHPDQEGFGEATLGEAQSENPPPDPEMLEPEAEEARDSGERAEEDEEG